MKKNALYLILVATLCVSALSVTSCGLLCNDCEIIDPDYILDEYGDDCDADFVDRCNEYEDMFYDVTCTC